MWRYIIRYLLEIGYASAITYMIGKWSISYAYLERGYEVEKRHRQIKTISIDEVYAEDGTLTLAELVTYDNCLNCYISSGSNASDNMRNMEKEHSVKGQSTLVDVHIVA